MSADLYSYCWFNLIIGLAFKNLCTPFYTFVHCCTLSPFITPCYLELDIVNAISADVQIWKLSLLLSKFENYLCFCPNLKTISAVVQIWKLSLLLSKFENYLSCCPKLKTIWNFNGELQQCTIVYNSVQQCTTVYNSVQQCTTVYNIVQHCTTVYNSVQ